MILTQTKLKEALIYDKNTGVWTWRADRRSNINARKNERAGNVTRSGYREINIYGKKYQSSRLAFFYCCGYFPENDVDHINRVRDDDRWNNMREVSRSCNVRNTGNRSSNSSGVKGIGWSHKTRKWVAYIMVYGKQTYLGCYRDFGNAVLARLAGEQCLGWAGCDSSSPAYKYAKTRGLIQ